MGCVVENFAAHVNADAEMAAHNFRDHKRFAPPDLLIYQMSTGSPVAEHLLECDTKLVLNYHNITPSHYLDVINKGITLLMSKDVEPDKEALSKLLAKYRYKMTDMEKAEKMPF